MNKLTDFCTELRGANGSHFGGPLIRAMGWEDAQRRARCLGVIVTGQNVEKLDAETLESVKTPWGNAKQNAYARLCASESSPWRSWLADWLRERARGLCGLADSIEPCESRRGVVGVRP